MKKVIAFAAAALMVSTCALAAGKTEMKNVKNKTTIDSSVLANIGTENKMKVGTITQKNGKMEKVINETKLKDTVIINSGKGNEAAVGTIEQK